MANYERQPAGRQRVVWIALGVAVVIALATGFAVTTVLGVSDLLPEDILTTLTRHEPRRESGELIIIGDGPPTGVARGIQLGLIGLLLGGVPAAMLSAALVAFGRKSRQSWSGGWANVFLAGFVFQLSSLGFSTLLTVLLLFYARDDGFSAIRSHLGFLGVSLLSGAAGMRFWRELQGSVHDEPVRITPFQRAN